jgi:site-specific recombinase XerD
MGRHGVRRKIAKNIYVDEKGYGSVVVQVRGKQEELRFDPGFELETLEKQRDQLRADLHDKTPASERGTLAHDAVRYLKQIAGRPGFKADRSHLRAWLDQFGSWPRARIKAEDVRTAIAGWRTHGSHIGGRGARLRKATKAPASEKTLLERRRVLKHLYKTLDGPKADTPCDDVDRPKPPASTPVGVAINLVQQVADALAQRARGTSLKSAERQDYARYLMLTTTAQRPAQLVRAIAEDFRVREQFWIVRGAKGGPTHAIHLNKEMRAAVRLFLSAGALGTYDDKHLLELARTHGWPKTIPLYNARHSVAIDAIEAGADLGDVQALLGHASIDTTRRFYAGILRLRQKNVGKRLEGRLKIG